MRNDWFGYIIPAHSYREAVKAASEGMRNLKRTFILWCHEEWRIYVARPLWKGDNPDINKVILENVLRPQGYEVWALYHKNDDTWTVRLLPYVHAARQPQPSTETDTQS